MITVRTRHAADSLASLSHHTLRIDVRRPTLSNLTQGPRSGFTSTLGW